MAGHVIRLQRERHAHTAINWMRENGKRKRRGRRRYGRVHFKKTWKRWVSAGTEAAGSPATETDGDLSSVDAPRGTGGIKSE